MFQCDICGECCRNLRMLEGVVDVSSLDNGSGVCRHLRDDNRCAVYSERPMICRVDDMYNAFFKDKITHDEYYDMCYSACKSLKDRINNTSAQVGKGLNIT